MGIQISAPILHEDYNKTSFRANSKAGWLLEIIGLLAVLILPFIIGFSMGQFWVTLDRVSIVPKANCTSRYMMRAVAQDSTEYLWTSSPTIQDQLKGDPRNMAPMVSVLVDDKNQDSKPDVYRFTAMFPLRTSSPIAVFQFLPEMLYSFNNDILDLEMTSAPFVSLNVAGTSGTGLPVNGVVADGLIEFKQLEPLSSSEWVRYDLVYKRSYFDDVRDISDVARVAEFGRKFSARNESTPFVATSVYTTNDMSGYAPRILPGVASSSDNIFTASINMRVPPVQVDYSPSFAESLKQGWIQYFCIAYVIYWAYGIVRRIFVMQAFINTIAEVRGKR